MEFSPWIVWRTIQTASIIEARYGVGRQPIMEMPCLFSIFFCSLIFLCYERETKFFVLSISMKFLRESIVLPSIFSSIATYAVFCMEALQEEKGIQ